MKWWVDIANAPNVTVFKPVVEALQEEGHRFVFTVWDRGQARALAERTWPDTQVIGSQGFRMDQASKGTAIAGRAAALYLAMRRQHVDVALGHASNAQAVAARALRVPSVTMMDYEHHPANHVGFRASNLVALPDVIPYGAVRKFGLSRRRYMPYAGLKEDIALAGFRPEAGFRAKLGVGERDRLAVVRPAAEGALYHRHANSICDAVIDRLAELGCSVLISPRTRSQGERYEHRQGVRVLFDPVSGPDLLYAADVFVGGGGSMTRESAVLGTPTYSIFEGKPAAVDSWLETKGRLVCLRDLKDLDLPARQVMGERRAPGREALRSFVALLLSRVHPLVAA
ncbi:MAG: DUF354 domain-containing protein [Acidimicrobiales bacterium]